MTTLAITSPMFDELHAGLAWPQETAWVMTARVARSGQLLLARALEAVPSEAYTERTSNHLTISSGGFVQGFKRAAADAAVVVFVHTHPGVAASASTCDDVVDEQLRAFAARRSLRGYASLIVGGSIDAPEISGSLWLDGQNPQLISRMRVAGPRIRVVPASKGSKEPPALFDRHVRAFGRDGQRLLAELRVGVVGAGGTGSPTIEQLARLGVGTLIVYDDDHLSESNLTRVHQSQASDVGRFKVDVARSGAVGTGTGTRVVAFTERVTSAEAVVVLSECDVVFGCTDDQAGRLVLSRLAYQFLIPVIDCGVTIRASEHTITDVTGRVTFVAPGTPCLVCRGQVDVLVAGQQMRGEAERVSLAAEGYARDIDDPAPSVVAFTTAVSAMAINELLARLFGYGDEAPGQILLRFGPREVRHAGRQSRESHYCTDPAQWALGETDPPLGILGLW